MAELPPPTSWQEFEELLFDVAFDLYGPDTHKHGREGQKQAGVDVYSRLSMGWIGIQAKGRESWPPQKLTEITLRDEVEKAKLFEPALDEFVLATTARNDVHLQRIARLLTEEHRSQGLFPVQVWGWDDIKERATRCPATLAKHWPSIFRLGDAGQQHSYQAWPKRELPPDIADFTGRSDHVDHVVLALSGRNTKSAPVIVAISGMAGIGKSAVAVHASHIAAEEFPDGQLYVDLRGSQNTPLTADVVLASLLSRLQPEVEQPAASLESRAAVYRSILADRRVLVLLDNAIDEAQVRPLLPGSGSCSVVLTSRRRLSTIEGATQIDLGADLLEGPTRPWE